MDDLLLSIVMIGAVIVGRIVVDYLDRQRIREYIEESGGQVLDIAWDPFGPGWFGSRERIYGVKYKTHKHVILTATCKTAMFGGVYWTSPAETSETPAESIACMECGSEIPARQTRCPKCGWS